MQFFAVPVLSFAVATLMIWLPLSEWLIKKTTHEKKKDKTSA